MTVKSSRVAVDETAVTIGTEQYWWYASVDVETTLLLDVWISPRPGMDPATGFLVDGMDYLTALARCDTAGHLDYVDQNPIEKWFQALTMRIDPFHQTWMGGRASAGRWLTAFVHYYNTQRPDQALEIRTPAEGIINR